MLRRRDEQIYPFQMTDDELELLKKVGIPKVLRPLTRDGAESLPATTTAYQKMTRLLRIQDDVQRAEIATIHSSQELERLHGDATTIEELRREKAELLQQLRVAVDGEHKARRLLEVQTAAPAIATHAAGTGQ